MADSNEQFLRRAIRLAMNGRGKVEPNPMVGCILARDGRIIGEGWHNQFGGPHAEPASLADCAARGESPAGASAYVTLEPCCHTNKKTPPCAPRLIEAGIERIIVGCLDPNPNVSGKGIKMVREGGIEVVRAGETLEAECRQLIAPFLAGQAGGRPYVTAKWAQSANGKVAGNGGLHVRITGSEADRVVHQLRARSDAIVVGINTVLTDDPLLTARGFERRLSGELRRIVLDPSLRIPLDSKLVSTARTAGEVIVLCSPPMYRESPKVRQLLDLGVRVYEFDDADGSAIAIRSEAKLVSENPSSHILIEPGPTLAQSVLPWIDRLWVFRSPNRIEGGPNAPSAAAIPGHYVETGRIRIGKDQLTEYLNTNGDFYFAGAPSADFVLAAEDAAAHN